MNNNRYHIIERIGHGGMAIVYRAYDRLAGQHIALKQVTFATDTPSGNDTDAQQRRRRVALAQEFRFLATLRHPHIVSVLDFGFDDRHQPFYTMHLLEDARPITEYCAGKESSLIYPILVQVLQALAYLHRRGIIHRDLKPANVLVTPNGTPFVLDFGVAMQRSTVENLDRVPLTGTIAYLAPEILRREAMPSVQSDLYALGLMAYEVLVGQPPFQTSNPMRLIRTMMMSKPDTSSLPPAIARWLDGLLALQPADRPPTALAALEQLQVAIGASKPGRISRSTVESFLRASAFVGRDDELQQLTTALERLPLEGAFFLVGGESGVGKTRLVEELRVQALVLGVQVLTGQTAESGALPFHTWRALMRQLVLVADVDDLSASVLKELIPDIAQLLDRDVNDITPLSSKDQQDRLVMTIVELLKRIQAPTLLILEDLQWAIESLVPLQRILKIVDQMPHLMVVGTYRNDERPALADKLAPMQPIALERLNSDDVATLSVAMLGEAGHSASFVQWLHDETGGNAYFMVEVVRALAEQAGDLQRIADMALPQNLMTGGMKALLQRRLARLKDEQYALLEAAAIMGREIDVQVLTQLWPSADVQVWLYAAQNAAILSADHHAWYFAHDKLREAVLSDLDLERSRQLHHDVATAIETVYPNNAAYNEALLEHWHAAGNLDNELLYVVPVARYLIDIAADYERVAVVLDRTMQQLPEHDPRLIPLLRHHAGYMQFTGKHEAAILATERALNLARKFSKPNEVAWWTIRLADSHSFNGDLEEAQGILEDAKVLVDRIKDATVRMYFMETELRVAYRRKDSQRLYDLAIEFYDAARTMQHDEYMMKATFNMGLALRGLARNEAAQTAFSECLTIAETIGNQREACNAHMNLAILAKRMGQTAEARTHLAAAYVFFKNTGNVNGVAGYHVNLSDVAQTDGNFHEALEHATIALESFTKYNVRSGVMAARQNLADAQLGLGNTDLARHHILEHLRLAAEVGIRHSIMEAIAKLGHIALLEGDKTEALRLLGIAMSDETLVPQAGSLGPIVDEVSAAFDNQAIANAVAHAQTLDQDAEVQHLLATAHDIESESTSSP